MSEPPNDNGDEPLKDIPDIDSEVGEQDSDARKEADAIRLDEYEDDRKKQDHRRQQGLKNVVFWVLAAMVCFGAAGLLMIAGVWLIHVIGWHEWRWLTEVEIDHVETLLFSGAISAAVTLLGAKLFR